MSLGEVIEQLRRDYRQLKKVLSQVSLLGRNEGLDRVVDQNARSKEP
jgi:hypothetical protein